MLFNGRNTTVQLGEPMSLRAFIEGEADTAADRAARQPGAAHAVSAAARRAHLGPDLSHRRTIVAEVLRTRAVRAAVAQAVREQSNLTRHAGLAAGAELRQ